MNPMLTPVVSDGDQGGALNLRTTPAVRGLRIRTAVAADRASVADLLRGLSAESAYHRFQTGLGPDPRAAILDALLPDEQQGGAVLAHVERRLVGHGVWRHLGATPVAEIALVVADLHQKTGIGTALAAALLDDLATRGVQRVEVYTSACNRAVIRMVTRYAPGAARDHDGTTVTYRFPTPARLPAPAPGRASVLGETR
jgi:acetyltransferase